MNDRRSTLDGLQAKVAQTPARRGTLGGRRYEDAGAPRRDHVGRVRADGVGRSARPARARHASRDLARDPPGEQRRRHVPDDDTDARASTTTSSPPRSCRPRQRHGRGAHRLRRHRLRGFAGDGGARARPARAHPGALRRNAPVDAARDAARRHCSSRSAPICAPRKGSPDEGQVDAKGRRRPGDARGRRGRAGRLVRPRLAAALDGIGPRRQIVEAQTQLAVAKATTDSGAGGKASGASALALARAMPERVEMAGVLRQLHRAANRTDVRLDSVTPQAAAAQSGYSAVPMDVVVTGRYFGVQRFLRRLRTQAGVAGPHVHAAGRLFSVDSVNLAAGQAAAAARGHDPPERLHLQRVAGRPPPRRRLRPRPIPRLRARRLPPTGRTDEYSRDTDGRSPGRGRQCRPAQEALPRRTARAVGGADGHPASEAAEELGLAVEHGCAAGRDVLASTSAARRPRPARPPPPGASRSRARRRPRPRRRASAIGRMKPRDPFVPASRESAPASATPSSAPTRRGRARVGAAVHVADHTFDRRPGRFGSHHAGRRRARSRDAGWADRSDDLDERKAPGRRQGADVRRR